MLQELTGYFNSIKKTQAEMKVTLSEIRKIYREQMVEGMKPRIKSTIWNIGKKKSIRSEQEEEKRIQINKERQGVSGTTSRGPTFAS